MGSFEEFKARVEAMQPGPNMHIRDRTAAWVREALESAVQGLFDDPLGAFGGDLAELRTMLEDLVIVAADFGVNLDAIIAEQATDSDRQRMADLLGKA